MCKERKRARDHASQPSIILKGISMFAPCFSVQNIIDLLIFENILTQRLLVWPFLLMITRQQSYLMHAISSLFSCLLRVLTSNLKTKKEPNTENSRLTTRWQNYVDPIGHTVRFHTYKPQRLQYNTEIMFLHFKGIKEITYRQSIFTLSVIYLGSCHLFIFIP